MFRPNGFYIRMKRSLHYTRLQRPLGYFSNRSLYSRFCSIACSLRRGWSMMEWRETLGSLQRHASIVFEDLVTLCFQSLLGCFRSRSNARSGVFQALLRLYDLFFRSPGNALSAMFYALLPLQALCPVRKPCNAHFYQLLLRPSPALSLFFKGL